MEQVLIGMFAGLNGYDLLFWSVVATGLWFSFINEKRKGIMYYLLGLSFALTMIAGWITHIVVCLMQAKYLLLIAGAFIAPVGVIHGIGIWFGASW